MALFKMSNVQNLKLQWTVSFPELEISSVVLHCTNNFKWYHFKAYWHLFTFMQSLQNKVGYIRWIGYRVNFYISLIDATFYNRNKILNPDVILLYLLWCY